MAQCRNCLKIFTRKGKAEKLCESCWNKARIGIGKRKKKK